MTVPPNSFRHLQNTELFRLGLADTLITKRFDRSHVVNSYEYDHRSLSEELDQIELDPELECRLGENTATVARLLKSGRARGPILDSFHRIQMEQGDEAAFEYLRAEADGFHCTPYGHCITSFLVDRCPKHLQCFCGCKYLCATDLPETRSNLVQLRSKLQKTVETIEGRMLASQRTAKALSSGAPGASEALVLEPVINFIPVE